MRKQASEIRSKLWMLMRKIEGFTVRDLATIAEVSEKDVYYYVSKLYASGYLKVIGKEKMPGRRAVRIYKLIRDTGVLAPIEISCCYDCNLRKIMLPKEVENDCQA